MILTRITVGLTKPMEDYHANDSLLVYNEEIAV